jgi:UDP-perosamine 4-acetyltransferase
VTTGSVAGVIIGDGGRALVIGAGGHARVCVEVLRASGWEVAGAVDRDGSAGDVVGVPVIGRDDDVARLAAERGADSVCVAVGDNDARRAWVERVEGLGLHLVTAIASSAVVSPSATLGAGAQVLPGAVVNALATVGRGAIVNTGASVDHDSVVGSCSHVAPGVVIGGEVELGAGVLVGLGARILPGRRVGDGATVGAGAVVVADVAPGTTVVGVPARELRSTDGRRP